MWMSVKCFLECVSMASASTQQAPFSASAPKEWLLMSAAGCALVRTTYRVLCWCLSFISVWVNVCIKSKPLPALTYHSRMRNYKSVPPRPADGAVLPQLWRWALWDSNLREAPCRCLLLLRGCSLGPWMWRMSREGNSTVCPALSSGPRLLS